MPLLTYRDVRPWAAAIKEAAATRKMPPWFADPAYGKFSNDRALSASEIATLVSWADTGAKEGNPKDAPAARRFVDGWNIAKPDLVVEMPSEFTVPASGRVDYTYVVMPLNLTEDRWVQMAEARPGNSAVVHHMTAYIRDPDSKWLRGEAQEGVPFTPPKTYPNGRKRSDAGGMGNEILFFYVPGYDPLVFRPGQAKKIRVGSDLVLEMHYTPNGKEARDRSRVGMIFSREPVKERVIMLNAVNTGLVIPPGDPAYKVEASFDIKNYGTLLSLYPHMHLRSKTYEFRLVYPDGKVDTLLHVNRYNFHWQLDYRLENPIALEPGMKIACTAWYDNSPNNPDNPDPAAEVRYGEMSWEEMMVGVMQVAIDARLSPRDWYMGKRPN